MTRSKTGWLFLGSALVLALAGITPAVYAHGGDSTLIHACANKSSGEVKIVGANASCKTNETALDWPGTSSAGGGGGLDQVRGAVSSGQVSFHTGPTQGTDETALQFPVPQAGEFLSLAINPFSNTLTGTAVLTVRVNGTDTVLQVVIPAGSTSVVTANAVITVAPGDLVSLKMDTTGAASGTIFFTAAYVYRAS